MSILTGLDLPNTQSWPFSLSVPYVYQYHFKKTISDILRLHTKSTETTFNAFLVLGGKGWSWHVPSGRSWEQNVCVSAPRGSGETELRSSTSRVNALHMLLLCQGWWLWCHLFLLRSSATAFVSPDQFFKAGDHNPLHPPEQVADWEWAKGQALHGGTLRLLFTGC